jgi:hypothetical protein
MSSRSSALRYKLEDRGFETRYSKIIFAIYLILPAALGPGVYSASNINEYQNKKKKMFLESRARPVLRYHNLAAT